MAGELTPKQARFVDAYMGAAAGNATEAARIAGYKGNDVTLASVGAENLRKPQIAQRIAELQKNDPAIATREDRQRFWTAVMNDPHADMKDRLRASEILGKASGDFVERHEHTGANGGPMVVRGIDFTPLGDEDADDA